MYIQQPTPSPDFVPGEGVGKPYIISRVRLTCLLVLSQGLYQSLEMRNELQRTAPHAFFIFRNAESGASAPFNIFF